jgi:hypothetical protein
MPEQKDEVVDRARRDLAQRLGISESDVAVKSVEPVDFPDAALGAPLEDEMSAQMITPGWRITLNANDKNYEYRATARQSRLLNFNGQNHRV